LRNSLTRLSPAHREIVDLVYYHGRTIEEAAAIVRVPVGTAKTRMFYARKQLRSAMAARGEATLETCQ
jgi:RNA polymerase sigma-70 factor (ECF subfamily)